ncbi:hypothetical protein APP2_0359 [Actinobacillus pleuropneumoniae serovar 2 str. 4226]|nr:hypothetical protein APP2_0992 [Actinobacillus pleuropneumoniae serovar 2 str. 4226]EFL79647.1 hypothetical protein APP2_0359 [Actinobacillus pleuropneumoniae serovar 2 str. 4226]
MIGKKQKYSPEFKLTVIQAVKKGQFSAESASLHFGIANSGSISQWLHIFEEQGINGLLPKPKGRPTMKPKYPKMPPPPKTKEERLRYRILELEAENAYLKSCGSSTNKKCGKSSHRKNVASGFSLRNPPPFDWFKT